MRKGHAYILSAPAGTGKTTLINRLTKEVDHIVRSVSYTTREIRKGEKEGVDYHFISYQEFEHKIKKGDFIEYAEVFGNFYGTDKASVERVLNQGNDIVLVIDTQGALAIRPFFEGVYIFMGPPSFEELEKRLKGREREDADDIEKRLLWAKKELELAKHYDYNIINCNLEKTYTVLKSIFIAEKYRVTH